MTGAESRYFLRINGHPHQRIANWPKHELPSVEEHLPECLIKRPEKRDQMLQFTVRTLAEQRRHLCIFSRFFMRENLVPHLPIVCLVNSPPFCNLLFDPPEVIGCRSERLGKSLNLAAPQCVASLGVGLNLHGSAPFLGISCRLGHAVGLRFRTVEDSSN